MKLKIVTGLIALAMAGVGCTDGEPGTPTETITVTETVTETITPTDAASEPAADSCDSLTNGEELAFIFVTSPAPGAEIAGDTIGVEGCSNTNEAGYLWELVDRDGNVVTDGNGTASCGTGCVGTFSFDIAHELSGRQVAYVHVFDLSAEDNSRELETVIPVIVGS